MEVGPPLIFVHLKETIFPSTSFEPVPSSTVLSLGRAVTWSGPASAIGGLTLSMQFSQEVSLLHELINTVTIKNKFSMYTTLFNCNEVFYSLQNMKYARY
jgi:hypothetical protein